MEGPNATWRNVYEIQVVAETGSTNTDLLMAAGKGAPHGSVLIADHQTAGRGRLDRTWDAPPGANLLMSILFRHDLAPLHRLTQRVSLAAITACEQIAGVSPVLKWPNDLLLDGSKLAGVLAQATASKRGVDAVVVGIGLNIGWAPPGAARLPKGSRDAIADALLADLHGQSVDITLAYRQRLATLGQTVRAELPTEELVGVAIDIDADGGLVIETADGVRTISVGDVTHLRPI
jgi:BirA family transcriptional regulator, biotin operon repressor / biotin---[acetyl-CoA-carboxylase] ligase